MSARVYAGGCLCGAVRYELSGAVSNPCFCHCTSCRRASGAPMVPWATFPRAGVRVTRGALTEFRSSPGVWRGFCAACGTQLTYRKQAWDAEIDVALATLDEPALIQPRMHVWVAERLPWVVIGDQLPQFAGNAGPADE